VKFVRKKKTDLDKINSEFQEEIRNAAEKLFNYMIDYIEGDLTKVDERFQEVILCEKACDRLKEKYLEILFRDKRALPFLVEDRYRIITSLDKIANMSEETARYMQVLPTGFTIFPDIKDHLRKFIQLYLEAVNQLLNCTLLMETDFKAAYDLTFEVEKHRRNAHNLKFEILDVIFKKKDEPLRVNLTWKIVVLIFNVVSWAEEISDYLRGLIIKYPGK
jgi:predicted phosphate transport protein (TIGR00153 family)